MEKISIRKLLIMCQFHNIRSTWLWNVHFGIREQLPNCVWLVTCIENPAPRCFYFSMDSQTHPGFIHSLKQCSKNLGCHFWRVKTTKESANYCLWHMSKTRRKKNGGAKRERRLVQVYKYFFFFRPSVSKAEHYRVSVHLKQKGFLSVRWRQSESLTYLSVNYHCAGGQYSFRCYWDFVNWMRK